MFYFNSFNVFDSIEWLKLCRKYRSGNFSVGDILGMYYRVSLANNYFEGFCLSQKFLKTPEFTFILRNLLSGIAIEVSLSFFYNRIFYTRVKDYKRKSFFYAKSKLYYIRETFHSFSAVI